MTASLIIAGYGFREAVRRKVFVVVVLLTAIFLALFWLANHYVFARPQRHPRRPRTSTSTRARSRAAFLLGLAMFATLFLGVVLAVFLTLGVVSGRRGARAAPAARRAAGRPHARCCSRASSAPRLSASVYVLAVYVVAVAIIGLTGHWWPHVDVWPGPRARRRRRDRDRDLAASARSSSRRRRTGSPSSCSSAPASSPAYSARSATRSTPTRSSTPPTIAAWALPFEALYQDGLRMITSNADRRHRLSAPARPVRRRVRPRLGDPRLGGRLPLHRARPSAVRVLAPRSLTGLTAEPNVLRIPALLHFEEDREPLDTVA